MKLFILFMCLCLTVNTSTSYLRNSKLCRAWSCIDRKLGLSIGTSTIDEYVSAYLQNIAPLLPGDDWEFIRMKAIEFCYEGHKSRRYTNTCPGQAVLHCVVEQLVQMCPEKSTSKTDACSPVSSLAGFKYMFSQSRYENLEQNILVEQRPPWFIKHYFNEKCCVLPELFTKTIINSTCGFSAMVQYYPHKPPQTQKKSNPSQQKTTLLPRTNKQPVNVPDLQVNPMSCCDLSNFIDYSFISECKFDLNWNEQNILDIKKGSNDRSHLGSNRSDSNGFDVQLVPVACSAEECVFKNLQIVSANGTVDRKAFAVLLDNYTQVYPEWSKAKARVISKCLERPITEYDEDCEINRVLACTFDILSEHCPTLNDTTNACKHRAYTNDDQTVCQISSSKIRPKKRRQLCPVPSLLVGHDISKCGISSIFNLRHVARPVYTIEENTTEPTDVRSIFMNNVTCKSSTESFKCLMSKMGVLSKYGFIDYFKMKDKIRKFTNTNFSGYVMLSSSQFYNDDCTSLKKLLNVIYAMITSCPESKIVHSVECDAFFENVRKPLEPKRAPHSPAQQMFSLINRSIRIPFQNSLRPPNSKNSNLNIPIISRSRTNMLIAFNISKTNPHTNLNLAKNIYKTIPSNTTTLYLIPVYARDYNTY